jgi:hypothetical protein
MVQHHDSDEILVATGSMTSGAAKTARARKLHGATEPDEPADGAVGCELELVRSIWNVAVADEGQHTLPPSMGRIAALRGSLTDDGCVDAAFAKFRWRQRSSTVNARFRTWQEN